MTGLDRLKRVQSSLLNSKNSRNSVECASDRKDSHMFTQHPCVKNRSKQVDHQIKLASGNPVLD